LLGRHVGAYAFGVVLWLPLQVLFCLGIASALACLNVFLRDVAEIAAPLGTIWFFCAPIVYPLEMVPPWLEPLLHANPITALAEGYRSLLLHGCVPDLLGSAYFAAASLASYLVGKVIYRKTSKQLLDVI
jgi:lipopolysaccharide transport system permease protein